MSHMGFEVGASGYDPISKKSSRGFKKMWCLWWKCDALQPYSL
jgi:hypothetical protein